MKKYSAILGAAVVGLSASASFATITLNATTVAINTTLAANGWTGYVLTLTASGTSTGVAGVDFKNTASASPVGGNIGIVGNLHQSWTIQPGGSPTNPTPSAAALPGTLAGTRDSFWLIGAGTGNSLGYLSNPDAPSEDNNLQNGSNPPYTQSPLNDKAATSSAAGFNNGVGSLMTISGAYQAPVTGTTTLAFIIVPTTGTTTIRGFANDQAAVGWTINTTLGAVGPITPEPASIGLLALGGLGLLSRRRRA